MSCTNVDCCYKATDSREVPENQNTDKLNRLDSLFFTKLDIPF